MCVCMCVCVCVCVFKIRIAHLHVFFFLLFAAPPRIVSSSRKLLNHRKGETITLFCNGKGSPEPSLQWHKDGSPLVTAGRVTVEEKQVHIVNLQRDDSGIYSCTFTNSVGEISQLIKLVVEGEWPWFAWICVAVEGDFGLFGSVWSWKVTLVCLGLCGRGR